MAGNKTQKTETNVVIFLNRLPDEQKRRDSFAILELMQQATGLAPKMWGASIVGFGEVHYKYESGREGDWFLVGFSPRKQNLTLYIPEDFPKYAGLLARLGKHKTGKACIYIKKLGDVDPSVLKEIIRQAARKRP